MKHSTHSRLPIYLSALAIAPIALSNLTSCANTPRPVKLLGDPAPASAATQTIVITPTTRAVNVTGGDIVNFIVGDKSFAWTFFVAKGVYSFDLNQIAPAGILDHQVTAYIAPDPRYIGGRDGGGNMDR